MSGPAFVAVLQFAGLAMSAKTVVDGIKEGNFTKAAIGGIGAYFAMSGLTSQAATNAAGETAASQATRELGSDAATQAADSMVAANTNAAANAAGDAVASGADVGATQGLAQSGGQSPLDAVNNLGRAGGPMSPVGAGPTVPPAGEGGFLSKVGSYMEKNPTMAFGAMQMGGNLLSGYAQGQALQDQMDAQRKAEEESRRRREYSARPGFLSNYRYDPSTMNWSPNNG